VRGQKVHRGLALPVALRHAVCLVSSS
jgi:hypothetical protein